MRKYARMKRLTPVPSPGSRQGGAGWVGMDGGRSCHLKFMGYSSKYIYILISRLKICNKMPFNFDMESKLVD